MPSQPKLTAIVVAWNVRDLLERCLRSLEASHGVDLEIVVIDNASADQSAELVRQKFPNVRLIENKYNAGFAAAVNQGLTGCHNHVVLINPDLAVEPQTLQKLSSTLEDNPAVGIVGPRISFPDGQLQPSMRRFPTTGDLIMTLLKLPNFFPGLASRYAGSDLDYEHKQTIDQVMGSCFLIRHETLEAVGVFDEAFYIWFEEVDFCKRAAKLGWTTFYTPSARAIHEKGSSFRQLPPIVKHRLLVRSMVTYARKHLGLLPALSIFITGALTTILSAIQQLFHLQKPASARHL